MLDHNTLSFLAKLEQNNNREWFLEHKAWCEDSRQDFEALVQQIRLELLKIDEIEKTKIYRIYRDLRFTTDKTPYKTHFAAHFRRKGKYRRGGFYFQVSSNEAMIGGGFWGPDKNDLQYIRERILSDSKPMRMVIESGTVRKRFSDLEGEELKTAPRGVDSDHPDIDLLRKKQFLLTRKYQTSDMLAEDFPGMVAADFAAMIPVFQVLTDYLVFDGNGVERK